jgi:hypothetical protein
MMPFVSVLGMEVGLGGAAVGAWWRSSWGLVVLRHGWPLAPREQMGIGHAKGSSGDGRGWAANVRIACSFCHLHMSNSKIDFSYQSNMKPRDVCVPTMYFFFLRAWQPSGGALAMSRHRSARGWAHN